MSQRDAMTVESAMAILRTERPTTWGRGQAVTTLVHQAPAPAVALARDRTLAPRIRLALAVALGRSREPAAAALLRALATEADLSDPVRTRAATQLVRVSCPDAIALVADAGVAALVRLAAAAALMHSRHGAAVLPVVRPLALDKRQPPVRRIEAAALLLRQGESAMALPVLRSLVDRRPTMVADVLVRDAPATAVTLAGDATVGDRARLALATALARRGLTAVTAPAFAELARDASAPAGARLLATLTLTGHGTQTPGSLSLLWPANLNVSELLTTHSLSGLLVHLRQAQRDGVTTPESAPFLPSLAEATDIDPLARLLAADALARHGQTDAAVPVLRTLANDRRSPAEVRLLAADALVRWGHSDEAPILLAALATDHRHEPVVRLGAADALVRIGQRDEAVTHLRALMNESGVKNITRISAARRLRRLGATDGTAQYLDPTGSRRAVWAEHGDWPD